MIEQAFKSKRSAFEKSRTKIQQDMIAKHQMEFLRSRSFLLGQQFG
jgi:hypothetical protein